MEVDIKYLNSSSCLVNLPIWLFFSLSTAAAATTERGGGNDDEDDEKKDVGVDVAGWLELKFSILALKLVVEDWMFILGLDTTEESIFAKRFVFSYKELMITL